MEEVEIRLNNFLFNSGIIGFLKIIDVVNKNDLIKIDGNVLKIKTQAFENFEDDYIQTMLEIFGNDTRWASIINQKEVLNGLDLSKEEDTKKLKDIYSFLKKSLESASYMSGYEIVKNKDDENPYEYIAKKEKSDEEMKNDSLRVVEYLNQHKATYCMKDIIYNKINMFWENVSFLNNNANKKDIKEEYKKGFVTPVIKYLNTVQKAPYHCIECGNIVGKSSSFSMSWLKDTGVDINRKTSAFWNNNEDAFICPVCYLIYSCVPLGFCIVKDTAIFINQNNSIKELKQENQMVESELARESQTIDRIEYCFLTKLLEKFKDIANKKMYQNEINNIQVIKKVKLDKDNVKYEFNMISKNKLKAFEISSRDFEKLINKRVVVGVDDKNKERINIYQETLSNFIENKNQYLLLDKLIKIIVEKDEKISYLQNILNIQVKSKGGEDMEEITDLIEKARWAGRKLKEVYFSSEEENNKLRSLVLQLNNALRANNATKFMDIITRLYGSLGEQIPCTKSFEKMIKDKRYFRDIGYAYIIGLEGYVGIKKEENNNEE